MDSVEAALASLRAGAYDQASDLLAAAGAAKSGGPLRARAAWAVAQVLRLNLEDETIDAVLEVARRTPKRDTSIYQKLLSVTGPLEAMLLPEAAREVQLRLGDYFLRSDRPDEAMPWLVGALSGAPGDPIAIYLEANCRFALYGERQAVRDMEEVLHRAAADTGRSYFIGGGTAAFWYRLALAHDRMKNLVEAAGYAAEAVARDPENETPRVLLGDILIRLERFGEAVAALAPVPKFAAGYRFAARLRAIALFRTERAEDALALLQELAEIDPLGAAAFLEMGRIHLSRGDLEAAEAALARAFRTSPELPGLNAAIVTLERRLSRHLDPDAGLPPAGEFVIPQEFAPRPDDPGLAQEPNVRVAWATYLRVLRALIVRDMLALYSHSGMGYLWALAQPMALVGALALVYVIAGRSAPLGTSVVAYLAAGIVPYVSFYARVQSAVSSAVRSNVSLLYFRQVTPVVLITAAFLREYLTSLVVFAIIAGGIAFYDKSVEINDPLTIFAAVTSISLIVMVLGTLFGLGELAIPSLLLVETMLTRVMLFFSGALYYANLVPARLREAALLNPLLHLIEFVRGGYFSFYHPRYANWHYPLEWIVVGIAFMMLIVYSTRRYVVAQ